MAFRRTWLLSALLVAALTLTACGSDGTDTTASGDSGEKAVRIAFFNIIAANHVTAANLQGVKDEAKKWGATVTEFDANFDEAKQIGQMQDAIASKQYDAWVVMPVNGASVADTVKQAIDAGIVVVADWNNIGPDLSSIEPQVEGITSVVAQPFQGQGEAIANSMVEACQDIDPCDAVYMPGSFNQGSEQVRMDSLKAVLSENPNIELHTSADGEYAPAPAETAATDTLLAIPGVDVFGTPDDQMAFGIVKAIEKADKQDMVKVVSAGTTTQGVQMVRDGTLFANVVTLPYSEGLYSARFAIQAVLGEGDVPAYLDSTTLSPIGVVATEETLSTSDGEKFKGEYEG